MTMHDDVNNVKVKEKEKERNRKSDGSNEKQHGTCIWYSLTKIVNIFEDSTKCAYLPRDDKRFTIIMPVQQR